MITLYQFPPAWDVYSASCFCAKLEAFMRWKCVRYKVVSGLSLKGAPQGKVPYVEWNGEKIGDSERIIERLGVEAYPGLDAQQKAQARAIRYLCEEGIYRAMSYFRFVDEAGWRVIYGKFFSQYPRWAKPLIEWKVRRYVKRQLVMQGIGRHGAEEVARLGMADVDALSDMLGDRTYFLGTQMTLADITVFSVMANLIHPPFDNALVRHARGKANLVAHAARVKEACFS